MQQEPRRIRFDFWKEGKLDFNISPADPHCTDVDDDVVSGEDDDVQKCKFVYPSQAHPSAAQ